VLSREIRRRLALMAAGAGLLVLLAGAAGLLVMYSGVYDISAIEQHTAPVYRALEIGMRNAVRRRAAGIETPPLDDEALVRRGLRCFHDNCVQCHGGPGIAPADIAKGLQPVPSSLAQTARDWRPAELYWVTRNGIKMAGMPAWAYRMSERDLWATVAFLERLPHLGVREYRELLDTVAEEACMQPEGEHEADPRRGLAALRQYACHGCHRIPGIRGPDVYVGPPLERFAERAYIAGVLPNTRENLVRWITKPQSVSPLTLMPDLGVTEAHAHDMAAYLESLR